MLRVLLPLLGLLVLPAAGCASRDYGAGNGGPLLEYRDTDWSALEDRDYKRASSRVARTLGIELPDGDIDRSIGPVRSVAHPNGGLTLIVVEPQGDAQRVHFVSVGADGTVRDRTVAALASGSSVGAISDASHAGIITPMVAIALTSASGLDKLYVVLDGQSATVVRAESGGQLANQRLSSGEPGIPLAAGDISGGALVERLAATVALAAADQASARNNPAVIGHLNAMASGTDLWLAQAAAELLTLPTN